MINHKLEIVPSLNGYELKLKDVTGFSEEGYSEDTLNVNNVRAIVFVLKDSSGNLLTSKRITGSEKNEFMTGLTEVTLSAEFYLRTFLEFSPDLYTVETYLITKDIAVRGLANYSEVTGTHLDVALEDPFIIDDTIVYEVDETAYMNGGTVLQLKSPIERFFNEGSFGYNYNHKVANYIKSVKVLYKLSCMGSDILQKDGEAANYAVLAGHVNVVQYQEDQGNTEDLISNLKDMAVLTQRLKVKYKI